MNNSNVIIKFFKEKFSGIIFCAFAAVPPFILGKYFPVIGGPVFAILLGMIMTFFIKKRRKIQEGIGFTSKKILQYAVILLGFGMNFKVILAKGIQSLPIIIITITTSLVVAFLFYKLAETEKNITTLIGVGSSICGGSAIAATAPIIKAKDHEIAQAISVIFLFNVIAALIFPSLGGFLNLTNQGFGLFAGTAVNDTSSVTAAASAWDGIHGSHTLEAATIVKLTRTLAIIPVTLILSYLESKKNISDEKKQNKVKILKIFPTFILFFLGAAMITTVFNPGAEITMPVREVSKYFIIMAMVAIGMNTDLMELFKTGGRPVALGFCCWVAITAASLLTQFAVNLM